jgi:hypothetical protein
MYLTTTLFQAELARYCLINGCERPTSPEQHGPEFVAAYLPWHLPESLRSWYGQLVCLGSVITCMGSFAVVVGAQALGEKLHKDCKSQQQILDQDWRGDIHAVENKPEHKMDIVTESKEKGQLCNDKGNKSATRTRTHKHS